MRINEMITKGRLFNMFSWLISSKKMYGDQSGEFACGYWGLKG